jgi:hypothetical protein
VKVATTTRPRRATASRPAVPGRLLTRHLIPVDHGWTSVRRLRRVPGPEKGARFSIGGQAVYRIFWPPSGRSCLSGQPDRALRASCGIRHNSPAKPVLRKSGPRAAQRSGRRRSGLAGPVIPWHRSRTGGAEVVSGRRFSSRRRAPRAAGDRGRSPWPAVLRASAKHRWLPTRFSGS